MVNCDEMAQVFRASRSFGARINLGVGVGVNAELHRVQLPASQVMSMHAMVMECRLWALGVPGHDADHLSDRMLRLAGVYVAADESQLRDRLKLLEDALGRLKTESGGQAVVFTAEQRAAVEAKGAAIFRDPTLALTIIDSETLDQLRDLLAQGKAPNDDVESVVSALDRRVTDLELGQEQIEEVAKVVAALRERISNFEPRQTLTSGLVPRLPHSHPDETLYFPTNVSAVSTEMSIHVASLIHSLRNRGVTAVDVIGFADIRGSEQHNAALSLTRAQAVAAQIAGRGIHVRQILGGGETNAIGDELSANRRVWIVPVE